MDKKQLYRNIAQVRRQLFALTTLIGFVGVAVASLIAHGSDFYLVFQNSVLALLFFGAMSYLWGYLYQRIIERPLIESYRDDAKKRIEELKTAGLQRMAMNYAVADLAPGMKVVEAIYNNDGALLVRAGAVLTDRLIQTLRENNVATVRVEAQRQITEEVEEDL